jgi:hypothetical protein
VRFNSQKIIFSNIRMAYAKKAYRPRRKAPYRAKKRNYRRAGASKMPLVLSKLRTLERTRETKCIQAYSGVTPISSYAIGAFGGAPSTLTIIPLSPNNLTLPISQGTGQANRIGNKIETKKATIKMMFVPAVYSSTENNKPQPQVVKVWGLWFKQGDYSGAPPANMAHFFQSGNTSITPQSNLLDDFLAINKQAYSIAFSRTLKIGNAITTATASSATAANNQGYSNNDFKLCGKATIDYTKHLIKMQKFNDTDNEPSNRQLFLVVEAVCANNDVNSISSGHPVEMVYEIDYRFQDA